MRYTSLSRVTVAVATSFVLIASLISADDPVAAPKAFVDGTGPGWAALGLLLEA